MRSVTLKFKKITGDGIGKIISQECSCDTKIITKLTKSLKRKGWCLIDPKNIAERINSIVNPIEHVYDEPKPVKVNLEDLKGIVNSISTTGGTPNPIHIIESLNDPEEPEIKEKPVKQKRERKKGLKKRDINRLGKIISWLDRFQDNCIHRLEDKPTHRCYVLGYKGDHIVLITTIDVKVSKEDMELEESQSDDIKESAEEWNKADARIVAKEWFLKEYHKLLKHNLPFSRYRIFPTKIKRR